MPDRIFAGFILLIAVAYTIIAFTVIRAPFQYDPLGPETWPKLVGIAAIICASLVALKPDVFDFDVSMRTAWRLASLLVMLLIYSSLFKPLGFVLSTLLFCLALSKMLGATLQAAVFFGVATGLGGYLVFTLILNLNLPAGILKSIL